MPRRIHHAQVPWSKGSFNQLRYTPLHRLWWIHAILLLYKLKEAKHNNVTMQAFRY